MTTTPPPEEPGESLEVQLGNQIIRARGWFTIGALLVLANFGLVTYHAWHTEQVMRINFARMSSEHRLIAAELSRTNCIQSLSPDQRETMRQTLGRALTMRDVEHIMQSWCPWIRTQQGPNGFEG